MLEPLTDQERFDLWADVMRRLPASGIKGFPMQKAGLRALLDAMEGALAASFPDVDPPIDPALTGDLSPAWVGWLWDQVKTARLGLPEAVGE